MKTILSVMCLIGWISIQAQTIQVLNKDTKKPIANASFISNNPQVYAQSDRYGKLDIQAFSKANKIEVSHLGYEQLEFSYSEIKDLNFQILLTPKNIIMNEVVISANKWKQTSNNLPSKVVRITPKDVQFQNPQTAADLLNISGNVFIQKSQQGGGSPMIRGFATNRLLYSVDGVRMNTAIFRGGNIQNVISLDAFSIENTEVLFGPGSVMYGSDAIGGVMSFQTIQPRFSLNDSIYIDGSATTRFSSANNERTGNINLHIGWKKLAFATSITSSSFDDLMMGSNGPDDYLKDYYIIRQDSMDVVKTNDDPRIQRPSAYSQKNITQKVRFRPNDKWDFQYGLHYSETSDYGRYDRHNRIRNDLPRYAEWHYGPQVWMMNHLKTKYSNDGFLFDQLNIDIAQQSFEESRIDRDLNDPERRVRTENVEAYSLNLDFIKSISEKNQLFYGFESVINDVNSVGTLTDITTGDSQSGASRYPQASWISNGIYIKNQHKFNSKWLAQAGIRYNTFSIDAQFDTSFYPLPFTEAQLNNGALTGSFGAVYRPNKTWIIQTNLATAFRSPNVDDIGKVFDSEPGAVIVPNPQLSAEYAYNADLGIAKIINDQLKIEATGYYTLLDNALVRRDFTLNGQDSIVYDGLMSRVQAIQNAAVARVYGIQLGASYTTSSGFYFHSTFNYQKGEEETNNGDIHPSRHAAPWFGITRIGFQNDEANIQLFAQYQGEVSAENMPLSEQGKTEIYALNNEGLAYAPAWYTLNLRVSRTINEYLTVFGGIENITDQRYRPYSSGMAGSGRNFVLSMTARF